MLLMISSVAPTGPCCRLLKRGVRKKKVRGLGGKLWIDNIRHNFSHSLLKLHHLADNIINAMLSKDIVTRISCHVESSTHTSKASKASHCAGICCVVHFNSELVQESIISSSKQSSQPITTSRQYPEVKKGRTLRGKREGCAILVLDLGCETLALQLLLG